MLVLLLKNLIISFFSTFLCFFTSTIPSGGSKGARGMRAPGPKFFQFHAVFWKFWQNRVFTPPRGVDAPSSGKSWICHWFPTKILGCQFYMFVTTLSHIFREIILALPQLQMTLILLVVQLQDHPLFQMVTLTKRMMRAQKVLQMVTHVLVQMVGWVMMVPHVL